MSDANTLNFVEDAPASEPAIDFAGGRRAFLGILGASTVGATVLGLPGAASAQTLTNTDIFNFALNFEYLGAEFYLTALGSQLAAADVDGNTALGAQGAVSRGHAVPFADPIVSKLAAELADHERNHVRFLRGTLGPSRIARPAIDINASFTTAARAAGLVGANETFDAFANDRNFLLMAMLFEDVCVTALKGSAALLSGASAITAAAGLLAVEGYQAGAIRTLIYQRGLYTESLRVSNLRNSVDGPTDDDDGVGDANSTTLVPVDGNAQVFGRAPGQVLNIAYGAAGRPTSGLFFPNGVNGTVIQAG